MARLLIRLIIYAVIIYIALFGIFYFFQRQYIYFPQGGDVNPKKWGLPNVKLITLKTSDNIKLSAWYSPSKNTSTPTIVYFHGNYGHFAERASIIHRYIKAGYGMLLLSYRGYSGSEGSPSEKGFYRDGRAAINFLKSTGIKTRCMVMLGVSLGTGPAVQMASEYSVGALVLQSSFTSLADVGKKHYPIFPVKLLLKDRYDSYQKIGKITAPKLFIHGKRDNVIPFDLGNRLYKKAAPPKQFLIIPKAGHNDMPDVSRRVIQFLKQHEVCKNHA